MMTKMKMIKSMMIQHRQRLRRCVDEHIYRIFLPSLPISLINPSSFMISSMRFPGLLVSYTFRTSTICGYQVDENNAKIQ